MELNYAPPQTRDPGLFALITLSTLSAWPVLGIFFDGESQNFTVFRAVGLSVGAILPWLFAWRDQYRWWAITIGVIYGILALAWAILPHLPR